MNTAVLNEDRITATGTLSVPFNGRGPMPPLDLWKKVYKDNFFYQLYFQKEGVAESEFESDLKRSLFMTYTNSDGRGMKANLKKGKAVLYLQKTKTLPSSMECKSLKTSLIGLLKRTLTTL